MKERETYFDNQDWVNKEEYDAFKPFETVIVWDSHQPMFAYIDEPVMTFTQNLFFLWRTYGSMVWTVSQRYVLSINR